MPCKGESFAFIKTRHNWITECLILKKAEIPQCIVVPNGKVVTMWHGFSITVKKKRCLVINTPSQFSSSRERS